MTEEGSKERRPLKKTLLRFGVGILLPILLIVLLYVLQGILVSHPSIGEAYVRGPRKWLTFLPSKIVNLVPVSLTEIRNVSLALTSPFLIAWFIVRMVRAIKNKKGKKFFFRSSRILAWGLFILYAWFMAFHGFNYTRRTLNDSLGFGQKTYTWEELAEAYLWVICEINNTRPLCCEDENGVATYPGGLNQFFNDCMDYYEESTKTFPILSGNIGRPKPVALSHYWSYTNIVGMFDPFFAECNINKDTPYVEVCNSAFHEMSHLSGYAVENNAELASMLLRLECKTPEIRYTGLYDALPLIESDLLLSLNNNKSVIRQILDQVPLCEGYWRDVDDYIKYWDTINPPPIVEEVSNAVNDSFLKANQQKEGVQTYSMMPSVVADYYYTYVKAGE